MSSYIVERIPEMYGDNQGYYEMKSMKIVSKVANEMITINCDLKKKFHEILSFLGKKRNKIAKKCKTIDSKYFGVSRDDKNQFLWPFPRTPLNGEAYTGYRKNANTLINSENPSIKVCKLNIAEVNQWVFSHSEEDYIKICKLCSLKIKKKIFDPNFFLSIFKNKDAMAKLYASDKKLYDLIKIHYIHHDLIELVAKEYIIKNSKEKITAFVLYTLNQDVNGKPLPLTQYLTACNSEGKTDDSPIILIHQDFPLIEEMRDEMAKLFKKAIKWDGKELKELTKTVATFEYEFAHAMPFYRGSAAVSEWFERAIYLYHGYNLSYSPDKMVNLEALTFSLEDFVNNYDSMIHLEKIEKESLMQENFSLNNEKHENCVIF